MTLPCFDCSNTRDDMDKCVLKQFGMRDPVWYKVMRDYVVLCHGRAAP